MVGHKLIEYGSPERVIVQHAIVALLLRVHDEHAVRSVELLEQTGVREVACRRQRWRIAMVPRASISAPRKAPDYCTVQYPCSPSSPRALNNRRAAQRTLQVAHPAQERVGLATVEAYGHWDAPGHAARHEQREAGERGTHTEYIVE